MHRYLVFIKLHGWRNLWRELVAKSWWLGCKMKCAQQRQQIFSALLNSSPLLKTSARAVQSRDALVANHSDLRGANTLTPVLAGSTFQTLPLPL